MIVFATLAAFFVLPIVVFALLCVLPDVDLTFRALLFSPVFAMSSWFLMIFAWQDWGLKGLAIAAILAGVALAIFAYILFEKPISRALLIGAAFPAIVGSVVAVVVIETAPLW